MHCLYILLAGALFLSCAKKENLFNLPLEHQTLALKLGANGLGKPPEEFTQDDSSSCFFGYNYFLKEFREAFPPAEPDTPEHLSLQLMRAWNAMDAVLMRDAPNMRDSLDANIFFLALRLSAPTGKAKELLSGATLDDYIFAYTKYLPDKVSDEPLSTKIKVMFHLQMHFWEPLSFGEPDPGRRAFAFIRSRILGRKLNESLSEKQKLLMQGNSGDFIASLSEKQAKIFGEFQEYFKIAN